jgi:hypothetical protein
MEMDMHKKSPSPPQHRVDIKHVHDLNERTKELQCLYGAFRLLGAADDTPLEKALQEVVDLLPTGWQYPKIACARIIIGDKEYRSERYVQSDWILTADVFEKKEKVGSVEVAYAEMRPECFQGPFLEEEVFLLEAIGKLIGQVLQRKALEEEKTRLFLDVQKKYEKILRGFIPICASCKSIRDEEGVWHRLEDYVQKRTDATFSHGICPECLKRLYPYFENK